MVVLALLATPWGAVGPARAAGDGYAQRAFAAMSTRIDVIAPQDQIEQAVALTEEAFRHVEALASEWRQASPLAQINEAAGRGDLVVVPEELFRLVQRGLQIGALTEGAFDVTWAALWGLWDFRRQPPQLPDPARVQAAVRRVDFRRVRVDAARHAIGLPEAGMAIGLGGIAKGHALEVAARRLRAAGIDSALLSGGGQVLALGRRGDRAWRVGIRDPRGSPDDFFAFVAVRDMSLSTSGDYEHAFVLDGVRYHHILDPRTGYPARGLRSATVVTADPVLADALSTAVMVLGAERGLALVERLPGVECVVVDDHGAVHATRGLRDGLAMVHPPAP